MTEIQKTLRENGLNFVLENFPIRHKRHKQHQNLVLFKYDSIIDFSKQVTREARGIILDEDDNWNIVSRSFDKFFNYQEDPKDPFDWSSDLKFYKKEDGSIMSLYFYKNKWHVSTSGTPDAKTSANSSGKDFDQIFWDIFNSSGGHLDLDKNNTYIFEMCSPDNRIVIYYPNPQLKLLAIRAHSGEWLDPYDIGGIKVVDKFDFSNIEDVKKFFTKTKGSQFEGFVVVDSNFNRIKIKHSEYVTLHHTITVGTKSTKNLVELLKNGEYKEVIAYFPEYNDVFKTIEDKIKKYADDIDQKYDQIKHIQNQKDFALELKAKFPKNSGIIFTMRKLNKSALEVINSMSVQAIAELIDES